MMSHAGLKKRRPKGRSLTDFKNLTWAEKKLIVCARRGVECRLGKEVPEKATPDKIIRPELIRFLALGGDENAPVHEKGVLLRGAWIGAATGEDPCGLDFGGARLTSRLALLSCNFPSRLTFQDAHATSLSLEGSVFHGLFADRLQLDGGLFLRSVHAKGPVRLSGAEIGGNLDCSGGGFEGGPIENKDCVALACDGATIGGNIFFGKYVDRTTKQRLPFHAIGEVRLLGVTIGCDLSCIGAVFHNQRGKALICDGARIGGGLFFREGVSAKGRISFAHSKVATLADNLTCWPDQSLDLEGFRYERIDSASSLDADSRIAWLNKQVPQRLAGRNFAVQPWIHLAKVLREQGHFREAAEVDIAREERLRAAGKVGDPKALVKWAKDWRQLRSHGYRVLFFSLLSSIDELVVYWLHWLYGKLSGYGHRPMRIIYYAVGVWCLLGWAYDFEARNGNFTPANAAAAASLFNPWAYSLDLILPVVQLGEFAKWSHVSDGSWRTLAGWTGFLIYFEKIFGWIAALTLAAIAAGLVKRKDG